jgi:hypothetical protein
MKQKIARRLEIWLASGLTRLVSVDRDDFITNRDLNATSAFLIVQVTDHQDTDPQKANQEIQRVTVHAGAFFTGTTSAATSMPDLSQ